ncbi:thioredoxin-dependent thiol peroxidase [Hyphomicrobium sp. CS1GBMeth3]|uniref:thioredoxin-dependent thiol peroxidase n=1 Tax=Hyphomicrobium sp. CS1GBMeth3 TaxID=1892845 RepID=UPI0009F9CE8A|nr:thioredoxin-dependent thiol peroxidase [Hyphomicrobium sp. CS1GBMeth3]
MRLTKNDERKALRMLKEGDTAPQFDLPSDSGGRLNLKAFRGHRVVLYFYPKDDTEGCTLEAQEFNALAGAFARAGAAVIGISPDSVKSHDKFKCKHALELELASDEDKSVAEAYGVWVEKSMYGRTFMGIERSTFLISPKGKIERIWRKVRPRGHAEAVLGAITEKDA